MPVSYRIDRSSGVVLSKATGAVHSDDILDMVSRTINDPDRGSPYRELFDLREVREFDVDLEGIKKVVHYVIGKRRMMKFARVAYVASSDLVYDIGRMFEVHANGVPIEFMVFRDIGQASEWLGIEEVELPKGTPR